MISDKSGHWTYYSLGPKEPVPVLVQKARVELSAAGFTEDITRKPWYRFSKGDREVIICNHHEIAVEHTGGVARLFNSPKLKVPPKEPWPVVWVREPGQDRAGVAIFQLQKTVLLW